MKIQLNQKLYTPKGIVLKDTILDIETDENLIPLNKFWRDRLKDNEIDNCFTIIKQPINKSKK